VIAEATSADFWKFLLYDNVLTGDYQQLVPRGDRMTVQGGPLVHIRTVPEGGAAGTMAGTALPYTFYDRYTNRAQQPKMDRRQPLPSVFAPRFIDGGTSGFNTSLKIWREGVVPAGASCGAYSSNSGLPFVDAVRFDENENATIERIGSGTNDPPPPKTIPAAASVPVSCCFFPLTSTSGDVGGWLYLNLDHRQNGARPSQNWVITSMFADAINGTDATAIAFGNGCTPAVARGARIGPAPNPNP